MNANEIQMIQKVNDKGIYVSPRDIKRLCQHTLELRQVMKEVQEMLARIAPTGLVKAMVDNVLED